MSYRGCASGIESVRDRHGGKARHVNFWLCCFAPRHTHTTHRETTETGSQRLQNAKQPTNPTSLTRGQRGVIAAPHHHRFRSPSPCRLEACPFGGDPRVDAPSPAVQPPTSRRRPDATHRGKCKTSILAWQLQSQQKPLLTLGNASSTLLHSLRRQFEGGGCVSYIMTP